MKPTTSYQRITRYFLIRIIAGLLVVGGMVVLIVLAGNALLDLTPLNANGKGLLSAFLVSAAALYSYIFLYKNVEKRSINELSSHNFYGNAITGFLIGAALQSLFIAVLYIKGDYKVVAVNPVSFLLPAFSSGLTAGFVSELLIRGVFFRIIEEKAGTVLSLILMTIIFALLHLNAKGATTLSVASTAIIAGLLLSAGYVLTRSLWFTIFLHFAWDFIEPGVFGAINPGNTIEHNLFSSKIAGNPLFTGGVTGPQNSIQALLLCLFTSLVFLWLAKRRKQFKSRNF